MSTAPPSISPPHSMPSLTNVEVSWCVSYHSRAVNLLLLAIELWFWRDIIRWFLVCRRGVLRHRPIAPLLLSTPPQTHNYQWINVLVNKLLWMWYRGVKWPFSSSKWRFRAIFDDDKSICSYWVYYGGAGYIQYSIGLMRLWCVLLGVCG